MNDKERQARNEYMREYMRKYREENREKLNAQKREWSRKNPDKVKEQQQRYWSKRLKA